jgi:hypothetical protein
MTAWRTIFTDSETLTGVAPVCDRQDDPSGPHCGDAGRQIRDWVFDCCPHPHIETYSERIARRVARDLNAADAEVCS